MKQSREDYYRELEAQAAVHRLKQERWLREGYGLRGPLADARDGMTENEKQKYFLDNGFC